MSIPSQFPQIVAAARGTALQALALQAGQTLEGKVIGPAPNGGTQVQIAGQSLNLVLPLAAKPGDILKFDVQGTGAQMRLAIQASTIKALSTPPAPPQTAPPAAPAGNLQASTVQTAGKPQANPVPGTVLPVSNQGLPTALPAQPAATSIPAPTITAAPAASPSPAPQTTAPAPQPAAQTPAPAAPAPPSASPAPSPNPTASPLVAAVPQATPGSVSPSITTSLPAASAPQPGPVTPQPATASAAAPAPSTAAGQPAAATLASQVVPVAQQAPSAVPRAPIYPTSPAATPGPAPTTAATAAPQASPAQAPVSAGISTAAAMPSTPQAALAQMVQSALPGQNSIASLTAALTEIAGKVALPEPVVRAAQQVLAGRVVLDGGKFDAAALQKAVQGSGIFQEAALARDGALLPTAQTDMKSALLGLRQALGSWLGQQAAIAAASQPAPPLRGQIPRAKPLSVPPVDPASGAEEVGKHLLERTDAALSRVRLHQHASLPDPAAKSADWSLDLPVVFAGQQTLLQLQIHRDQQNPSEEAPERGWQMRFALNLPNMGEVGAQVTLRGRATGVMLWAADQATTDALAAEIESLRDTLASVGLHPGALIVRHGEPPNAQPTSSGHFVDARS